jgi:hypothetical protein
MWISPTSLASINGEIPTTVLSREHLSLYDQYLPAPPKPIFMFFFWKRKRSEFPK